MSPLENTIDYRDKMSIKLCDHAQCDRRNPKVMNEALNKACTAVGCSGSYDPLNPCGVE